MKKLSLILAMLGLGLVLTTSSAMAFSLTGNYVGPLALKFSDRGMGSLQWIFPQSTYNNKDGAEDAWGIFKVTNIIDPLDNTLWFDGKGGEELTGIYYGIDDDYWAPSGGGVNIQAVSGHIDVYLDSSPDYNPALGPGSRLTQSTYPNVTNGNLFLSLDLVPGIKYGDASVLNDHITYNNTLDHSTSPFTGDGAFYANVSGGAYMGLFDSDYYKLTDDSSNTHYADFFGQFDSTAPGSFGWLVNSHDPIGGFATPEPTSMVLLGMGVLGLFGLGRKKIKV